ncbi:MAG TPA: extracellular solute-binding protein [Alphaproteobacteria bacterium]|nr:extracellular solute-binding protein [Alphaproteobacteria bacterium]
MFRTAAAAAALALAPLLGMAEEVMPRHGIAMHGEPKYGPDFAHFDYVNPDAPKGGTVRLSAIGTYDTLNPYTLRGVSAAGLGYLFETLMVGSQDEAFTEYGLIAETVEVPEDRSWVAFNLRPEARFHDGHPITAEDVIWSFETLRAKGDPFYRAYYASVAKAEVLDERKVKFTFAPGDNHELPLIMGQLPVLPKHYWEDRDFEKTTLEIPVGSGAYRIERFEPGRSITYVRDPDYWGKDLPVARGFNNFERIHFDYYRDSTVALEAFKAGNVDFRQENNSKLWATAYDGPPVKSGQIVLLTVPHEIPTGMQGFIMNLRRPPFQDPKVRQALAYAFDFEWSNKNLFYGQYTRTDSYFSNSELASRGLPEGEELDILEKFRGRIPEEVFTTPYELPSTDGSGNNRENLRKAAQLLKEAGWSVRDGRLLNEQGQPFEFEILLSSADFERIAQPFAQSLKRLGIDARVRTVDPAQYQNRMENFDYDMTVEVFPQSLSPGNEQRDFWGSASADIPGGRNTIGIKDPVVDELVDLVISATSRESLVARTRALDRVLLAGHYVIPHWHIRSFRVALWDMFGRPPIFPKYGFAFDAWWVDQEKLAALGRRGTATN